MEGIHLPAVQVLWNMKILVSLYNLRQWSKAWEAAHKGHISIKGIKQMQICIMHSVLIMCFELISKAKVLRCIQFSLIDLHRAFHNKICVKGDAFFHLQWFLPCLTNCTKQANGNSARNLLKNS